MSTTSELDQQTTHWARVCLHSLLIVGIFAMHHLIVGQTLGPPAHVSMDMTSSAAAAHAAAADDAGAVPAFVHDLGDGGGAMSDCGALMTLCVAMLMGISVLILVRRRPSTRVLWQLPPPRCIGLARRIPPFHPLTPLQRSAVLRC